MGFHVVKNNLLLFALSAGFLTNTAMATTPTPSKLQGEYPWVVTLALGPLWSSAGESQTFYLAPEIEKTYAANRPTNVLADGEIFLGLQKKLRKELKGQLGLALAVAGNANLSGDIWDDADPEFDNYTYRYKIMHTQVVLKGKLLFDGEYWLIPWISASIGVGFNNAQSFTNTPIIFEALPNANFSPHTQAAFTYALGVGAQKSLNKNWQVGIAYEFADWGKSMLGRAKDQTLNSGLALNHLYTNGVLFNITYLA